MDSKGNLFVADSSNHCIRKITPDGEVSTLAGSVTPGYVDGSSSKARFKQPFWIAIDKQDTIYIADHANNRIRKIEP